LIEREFNMKKYGKVMTAVGATCDSFGEMISALNLKPPVLIKPNWGTVECYSEAEILDWTLAAIPGEKMVIESHGWARSQASLLNQDPGGLTKANLRKGDRWFLEYTHINQVLEKRQVEYLNLTEEVWAGRTADPALIQQAVEGQFAPVQFEELYAKVPARLYALRGGTLLSLSKYKVVFFPLGVSFSIKNLFGMITSPSRGKFHGKEHAFLDQSIVDINKIYRSLFSVKGIIEGVHSAGYLGTEIERTQVIKDGGIALASEDTAALDAFAAATAGLDPASIGHLQLAAHTFGAWDAHSGAEAEQSGIRFSNTDGFSIRKEIG
jgi:uncharacterized protein (DUF362 family)